MRIEHRLAELGLELPQPMRLPPGVELPFPWVRLREGRAFVSGHGPLQPDGSLVATLGKVGADVTEEQELPFGIPVAIEAEAAFTS